MVPALPPDGAVLEELASERAGALDVASLDLDDNPGVARRFGVMGVPTFLLFRDGQLLLRLVGARGKANLADEIDHALATAPAAAP